MNEYMIPAVAAFGAGILNTIAGGGTFLTFPALIHAGIPPVAANATSAVVVFPGYAGGALGFRKEIKSLDRAGLIKASVSAMLGGLTGSVLLVFSSDSVFAALVPFLLLTATFIFSFGRKIEHWLCRRIGKISPYGFGGVFLVSVYGGYFNGGLGIVLLALFALWGMTDINATNGLKNFLSFLLSALSFLTFTFAGIVAWQHALAMMMAAIIGGYCGAPIARVLPDKIIRGIVILTGLSMSAVFFARFMNAAI